MKTNYFFLLAIIPLFISCQNIQSDGSKYEPKDKDFTVYFPGEYQTATDTVETDLGDIFLNTIIHENSEQKAYMVAYSDYPEAYIEIVENKDLIEGGMDGALKSLNIDSASSIKEVSIGEVDGIYFKGENKEENTIVEYEIYLKENRLYQIAVIGSLSKFKLNEDNDFFNSFELK